MHEVRAMRGKRNPTQRRRCESEEVDRRAEVMRKARKRELGGAARASRCVLSFENECRQPGACERDRGDETVGPCTDDDCVPASLAQWLSHAQLRKQSDSCTDGTFIGYLGPEPGEPPVEADHLAAMRYIRRVVPMWCMTVDDALCAEVRQVASETCCIGERVSPDRVPQRREHTTGLLYPGAHLPIDVIDCGADLRIAVIVRVLDERAIVEHQHEWQRSQPRFELRVCRNRVQVGPVAATAQPQLLDADAVARAPVRDLSDTARTLEHDEQEQVVVADDDA